MSRSSGPIPPDLTAQSGGLKISGLAPQPAVRPSLALARPPADACCDHDHDHAHAHAHAHDHQGAHTHDHDHDHAHTHDHGHGHRHGRKHEHKTGHGHDHGHNHSHGHSHDHDDHDHGHGLFGHHHHKPSTDNETLLTIALAITVAFMLVEVAGGFYAHSLALIADAGHMLADAGSLALAVFALRASRRPANETYSYGHHRYEVLAAFVNGLVLLALSVWIVVESAMRLVAPQPVQAEIMMITALLGLLANLAAFGVLRQGSRNENLRAALLHVLSDLLGSVAAIIAGAAIYFWGWMAADPILSAFVALLIVRGGWALTRESAHILLEGVPPGLDPATVESDLVGAVPGVIGVHHLHAWALTGERPMMTLHAVIEPAVDRDVVLNQIQQRLSQHFGVHHATVQIEPEMCAEQHEITHGCAGSAVKAEPHPRGDGHGHN